jgi:hypothetical protein
MKSNWTIWVNANKETGAEKLIKRVLKRMDVEGKDIEIRPYHKGGYKIEFKLLHSKKGWNDLVVECIALGQRTAHGWGIYGDIFQDPGASSNRTNVAGVEMIEWRLLREST